MEDFRYYCPHDKWPIAAIQRTVSRNPEKMRLLRISAGVSIKAACDFAKHPNPAIEPVTALAKGIIAAGISNLVTGPGSLNWAALGIPREYFAERSRIIFANSRIFRPYAVTN